MWALMQINVSNLSPLPHHNQTHIIKKWRRVANTFLSDVMLLKAIKYKNISSLWIKYGHYATYLIYSVVKITSDHYKN